MIFLYISLRFIVLYIGCVFMGEHFVTNVFFPDVTTEEIDKMILSIKMWQLDGTTFRKIDLVPTK